MATHPPIARPGAVRHIFPVSLERQGMALAILFGAFALYGLWSFPGLVSSYPVGASAALVATIWFGALALGWPLLRRAPSVGQAAALAAVAIALRVGPVLATWHAVPVGDAALYPQLARHLLAGGGLSVFEPDMGITAYAFYPPAFPILLAGWGAVAGLSSLSVVLFNLAVDCGVATLIAKLGKRTGHAGAGRAAAWAYLIWPATLLSAPFAQKEGICILIVLALILAWTRPGVREAFGRRDIVSIGLLSGALALTQPGWAPLSALIGLAMVRRSGIRNVLRAGMLAAGVTLVVLFPWWIRNAVVLHAFVPLTSAGKVSLWVGNNPAATGNWLPTPPNPSHLGELAYGAQTAREALGWIVGHPLGFVRLTATKFVRAICVAQFGIVRMSAMTPAPSAATLGSLLPTSLLAHLALLGAASWAFAARSRRVGPIVGMLIVAALVQAVMFGVWFEFGERHILFLLPLLLLVVSRAVAPAAMAQRD